MKRVLEIDENVAKHFDNVLDLALKSAGLGAMQSCNVIVSSIKQVEDPASPEEAK